jgi:sterol desaturase/sphingolipid hydroxylase (fatty acid hydroxylase superfamily)
MEAILAIIFIFGTPLILTLGLVLGLRMMKNRHTEQMALINQGLMPPDAPAKRNPNRFVSLRNGIVLASLGIGIIVGAFLPALPGSYGIGGFLSLAASIVFFLGLGYLTYFFITRKMTMADESEIDFTQE